MFDSSREEVFDRWRRVLWLSPCRFLPFCCLGQSVTDRTHFQALRHSKKSCAFIHQSLSTMFSVFHRVAEQCSLVDDWTPHREPDSAHGGQQRNVRGLSVRPRARAHDCDSLTGKSAEERNAATAMLDILASTLNRCAALAANTAGRARMTGREDTTTDNGSWSGARLRDEVWQRLWSGEHRRIMSLSSS